LKIDDVFRLNSIIPAIVDDNALSMVLKIDCKVVFILYGNILNISSIIDRVKKENKIVFVNVDLIDGFSSRDVVVKYLKEMTNVDGILSSKVAMIKEAKKLGLMSILRVFLIDSFAYKNIQKQIDISKPDCIQVMPGWPRLISWCVKKYNYNIIAGGLLCYKEDVVTAINAGAIAISTTNKTLWKNNSV